MSNLITITNPFKTIVKLSPIGASIFDIQTIDKDGNIESVVVHPKNEEDFNVSNSYFGKTIGRTGGRIKDSTFSLDGVTYKIPTADKNGLHGGNDSLSFKKFSSILEGTDEAMSVIFTYLSKDMESGYPGNAKITITYKLYQKVNRLEIIYKATTDKKTLMNLSNHTYFNISGNAKNNIMHQSLYINSTKMVRIENLIPKEIVDEKEIYSFKNEHEIGKYLFNDEIINNTNGYDYPYILDDNNIDTVQVQYKDNSNGKYMNVYTTYPCVVVYTCNYVDGIVINNDKPIKPYDAICFEASYIPNSINNDFITDKKDILDEDKTYLEKTIFEFGYEK